MKPINEYDKESILQDEVFREIFEEQDIVYRSQLIASLSMRARELRIKGEFDRILKAYEKKLQREQGTVTLLEHWTNFTGGDYDRMKCGQWIATDEGIRVYDPNSGKQDVIACRHPIMPVRRMQNLQTDEEQVTIAFKRNGMWRELTVPKTTITQASKICGLSAKSVLVTSESAKLLVRYLADVEADNEAEIPLVLSSSKMGWIKGSFLPYDKDIVFDGSAKFRQAYEAIRSFGDRAKWYTHIRKLRRTGRFEIKFLLAASFASVLLGIVGGLPFIVDLWGETEGGKSVSLMVAASVWANPGKGMYIRDYASTDVGLEALADFLNHLPVILDDTSKRNKMIELRFEEIIYNLCSGKGKTRSNKDLGINRENTWENIILTNGEQPITSYVSQGGAYNRVLEVEAGNNIFADPQETVDLLKKNYGFAGEDFINLIRQIGLEDVRRMQKEIQKQIFSDEKMQKQSISLSIVLTADKIATDYLFKDQQYLSIEEAKTVLIDRNDLSENERCYQYISDKIAMNESRFDASTNIEKWGIIEKDYVIFYPQAFNELCQQGGFSKKSFLSWAAKKNLIQLDSSGKTTKVKSIGGKKLRCVFLKMDDAREIDAEGMEHLGNGTKVDKNGFLELEDGVQESIPFD